MKYFLLIFGFFILFLAGLWLLGMMHEQVHVEIFKSYGIDSDVKYHWNFLPHETIGEVPCPTDSCILAHDINEVVGYHLMVIYLLIGTCFIFLFLLIELND